MSTTVRSGVHGLAFERLGSGEPLLFIHGTGSSRSVWRPVTGLLSDHHELILVDLPGHGGSKLAPPSVTPTPIGFAPLLADLLDELGIERIHAAGNSIGGWTSLELAKLGRTRSVTALGPAGLWSPRSPRFTEASLWVTNRFTRTLARGLPYAFRTSVGRTLLLSQMFARPWRLTPEEATDAAHGMATVKGFDEHIRITNRTRFSGGQGIDVPVTIAFGTRERLLWQRATRRREELPPQTRWVELRGCGHVPTWDDPAQVAGVILETTGA